MIDQNAGFLYGPTAIYLARTPDSPAKGPFLAPADVLVTDVPYRSRQAATEAGPVRRRLRRARAAAQAGQVLRHVGLPGRRPAQRRRPAQITVVAPRRDRIPAVGEQAPRVETDTVASARGDLESIDTRVPPTRELHEKSLADVLGKEPVALLFATPQLCASRVCGPVVDEALQLQARYGDRMTFIHQEVYVDNDPSKGVREPMRAFGLPTEPWLFVIGRDGKVTARLEGSFGLDAFERALKTAL